MNKNSLIILRGLPGSGKSTLASLLSENKKYPVFSIDDYFTDEKGNYEFDPYKNHLAYKDCESRTAEAMRANVEKIFLDNTFTIDWEIEPYFKLAGQFNYRVFVITVENHHGNKNTHHIPDEHLLKMAAKYKVKLL